MHRKSIQKTVEADSDIYIFLNLKDLCMLPVPVKHQFMFADSSEFISELALVNDS